MPAAAIIAAVIGAAATAAATAATAAQTSMSSNDDRGFVISNAAPGKLVATALAPAHGVWATSPVDVPAADSPADVLQAWLASDDTAAQAAKAAGVTSVAQLNPGQIINLKSWYSAQGGEEEQQVEACMVHAQGEGVKAVTRYEVSFKNPVPVTYICYLFVYHVANSGNMYAGAIAFSPQMGDAYSGMSAASIVDGLMDYPTFVSSGTTTTVMTSSGPALGLRIDITAGLISTFEFSPLVIAVPPPNLPVAAA